VQEGRRDEFVRIMQERDTITGFESQIYRKDQSIIWISENCRAIRDSKNRLLYYEGTVEDITQRKLAEERLRDSEELYQSLVETLPQNIFRKDLQDRFTFANQVFCKTLGKSLDEIIGKTDFDFYEKDLAAKYQADDHKVRETGVPYDTVEENQSRGHSKMYVQVVKTPLRGANGQVIGLQGIFWDITEQRLNEEKVRRVNSLLAQNRKELRAKNMQMQDDLKMAREIQLAMLPQQNTSITPDPTDALAAYSLTHRYLPTGTVGGDFFSLAAISETEAGVFICDVAGHGVRSALVTAMIRALVEELKPLAREPGAFLSKLNRELYAILKHTGTPMLTTAFYLVADWKANQMHYSNAGHPKPLHLRRSNGTVQPLVNASGKAQPALGLFEDAAYQTTSAPLSRGDLVMLYTDGLVEVQNTKGEIYSQDLLIQCVQPRMKLPAAQLFDETLAEVRKFSDNGSFSDDVCIVGMEVNSIS
jgi:sigma-B regulation protein RsbU (phosphoserine phosphatase)